MKPVLTALCILIAGNSAAQGFSTGLRTGANHWFSWNENKEENIVTRGSTFTWNKEVYARYETKKRLAFELSAAQSRPNKEWFPNYLCLVGEQLISLDEKLNSREFNLSIQYRIIGNDSSKLKNYMGLSGSTVRYYLTTNISLRNTQTDIVRNEVWKTNADYAHCGLSNYTSYQLTKHFNVVSVLSFRFDPEDVFKKTPSYNTSYTANSVFSLNIGCGYTF